MDEEKTTSFKKKVDEAVARYCNGEITLNQVRIEIGLPPIDDKACDCLVILESKLNEKKEIRKD